MRGRWKQLQLWLLPRVVVVVVMVSERKTGKEKIMRMMKKKELPWSAGSHPRRRPGRPNFLVVDKEEEGGCDIGRDSLYGIYRLRWFESLFSE